MKYLIVIIAACLICTACSKNTPNHTTDFPGAWTLSETYGNDFWGGACYWKNADGTVKIIFTPDGKYFRKFSTEPNYTYIGTFRRFSTTEIEITQANLYDSSYIIYSMNYSFEPGDYLVLGTSTTEGIIKEKFKLDY